MDERGRVLSIVADVLGILTGLFFLWELGARFDIIPGPGPVKRVQRIIEDSPTTKPPPSSATVDPTDALEVPSNVQLTGGCDGYTLTWDPVEGADRYIIDDDQGTGRMTTNTYLSFDLFPDGEIHQFRVRAIAFGVQSAPSEAQRAGPCP
jgi:hypothetical protein